jgi:hypothetical protein
MDYMLMNNGDPGGNGENNALSLVKTEEGIHTLYSKRRRNIIIPCRVLSVKACRYLYATACLP